MTMSRSCVTGGAALCAAALMAASSARPALAASGTFRYGFRPGAVYQVRYQEHDVGKSVTTVSVMGRTQTVESPTDRASEATFTMKASAADKGQVRLAVEYGVQKGGERWAPEGQGGRSRGENVFGKSRAVVTVDPVKGAVAYEATPKDFYTELVYRGRFAWMPVFPQGSVTVGQGFTHEYVLKTTDEKAGGSGSVKVEDEYTLVRLEGGRAFFDVETRYTSVVHFESPPGQGGMPAGPAGMGEMTLAGKGSGTAVFDMKEGLFTEWEVKTVYGTPKPASASGLFSSRIDGTVRTLWELERR